MYVLRCPRISLSSFNPPKLIRTYFLFKAFATLFPNDVFPTPGGPYKQMMGDFKSPFNFKTAKCSMMRSFTFSKPK